MKTPQELRIEIGRLIQTIETTSISAEKADALAQRAFELSQQAEFAEGESRESRRLATWYREFAECAGSDDIRESRLLIAEALDKEADIIEGKDTHHSLV